MHASLSTLAGAEAAANPMQVQPNRFKKVKIGIVGLNFGRSIIEEILDPSNAEHFELVALCDTDETLLQRARPSGTVSLYRKIDDLLKDETIEAVGLFTGPNGRAELIDKIIESGRHVITTKPLERNADAMLKILRKARKLGCAVHANSPAPLCPPDLKVIQRWIKQYDLGRPVGGFADVWVSYRERADGTWYDDPLLCPSAPIYRLGIYLINDLIRLWGPVEKAQVFHSRLFTGRPTADNAQLGLLFRNKALATVYSSFCVRDGDHYRGGLTLNFENGTIYRNTGPAWAALPTGRCNLAVVKEHLNQPLVVAKESVADLCGKYQWDYFARRVRGEMDPQELTPEESVEGLRVIESIIGAGNPLD